ncbi:hypothetical protein V2J09_002165 [Rumex salicifolius]
MAAHSQGASPNLDLFDAYFKRADLDQDGRISGNEAVAFFQGSNLPKNILAQVWTYADQNRTGFLGRAEFYNALKLVTIAQSKRELTPDIVKAAFYGPASAKIPAPQINLPATSGPQPIAVVNVNPQVGAVTGSSPNPALRPVTLQNTNIVQQYNLSPNNQAIRPPQPAPSGTVRPLHSVASQGFAGAGSAFGFDPSNSRIQVSPGDGKTNGHPTAMASQAMDISFTLPATQTGLTPGALGSILSAPQPPASLAVMPSTSFNKFSPPQNDFASGSLFGVDGFSASQAKKKDVVGATSSNVPVSSGPMSVSPATPSSSKLGSLETTQNSLTVQSGGGQLQNLQPLIKEHQQVTVQTVPSAPGVSPQFTAAQSQQQWPRMNQIDLQKYTKLFMEVDKDKDGKITGEQARNLFLSWRLPRDILKQVWDLSDQDNDSMLSVKEFCIALYLMERYREGRPLPSVLPGSIVEDLPAAVQTARGAGHASWGYSHGPQQPPTSGFAARPPTRPSGRPPLPVPAAPVDKLPKQVKAKVPVLEKHLVDQLSEEEQKSLNSKFQEATEAEKRVEELEKEIKESREKMEFYRVKMQELILYKSRCDTRLNEVTERVSADKHEVVLLSKKYEEKYNQSGDVASRLTIEEATFRDIQERKMELFRAIIKLDQDGGTDEKLKALVEQIQSNLEELVKSLNERCKTYGLRAKPTTLVELPFGWQPAIQQGAADWDEDWDIIEDEGFTCVKELSLDVKNVVAPPKTKVKPAKKEESAILESEKPTSSSNAVKAEKADSGSEDLDSSENRAESAGSVVQKVSENGSTHEQADPVEVRSPAGSPAAKSSHESPHNDFSNGDSEKEITSDNRGTSSRSFNEPGWGRFDRSDDINSVWGAKPVIASKGIEDDHLFGLGSSLSLNPIKTGTKFGESNFLKKGSSIFADSVPGTPFSSSFSPEKLNEGPEHLPSFSRFDSFRSTDSGLQPRETLSRFDSMRSTDYESGKGFPTFDDSDTFGSGPFISALGSETPRTEVDAFGAGPFRSSYGSETPRTEVDAFGAGPFRSSFGSETPRTEADAFGAGPFKSSFGSETPRSEVDAFNAGPFRSTFGSETPRDSDPFGSGPFRSTFGSETPRDSDPFGSGPFKSSFGMETPRSESDPFGSVGLFRSSLGSETPRSDWMGSETPRGDFDSFGYGGPFRSSFGSETPRSEADPFGSSGPFHSTLGDETPKRDPEPFSYSSSFKSSFTSESPKGMNNWSAF